MLEELRDEGFGEFILIKDYEGVSFFRPSDQICVLRLLQKAKGKKKGKICQFCTFMPRKDGNGPACSPVQLLHKWRDLLALSLSVSLRSLGSLLQQLYIIMLVHGRTTSGSIQVDGVIGEV